jgi:flagellar L-ring protein precursor FlgH
MVGAISTSWAESLYDEQRYRAFIADPKAVRVGDSLTVVITEFASMTTTARTATDKDAALSGSVGSSTSRDDGSVSITEDFGGGGKIERAGKLVAQISVLVLEIKENGDLWVKGEQNIAVNEEQQKISVEGRVRRSDIRADNTILSSRLSDARISYVGEGLLAEKQRPGFLTRLLSWLKIL